MGSRALLNIIEGIEPGIVILNNDLTVSHINRMFILMFSHFDRERLFRGNIFEFHGEENHRKMAELLRLTREAKRQIPLSLKILKHDGLDCYFLIKLVPIIDRDMTDEKICVLFYDITSFVSTERKLTRVPVTSGDEIHLLKPEEIVYLKADNIYSRVITASGEYHCDLSLGAIEKRLDPEMFCRIHRSYLVNIARVRKVQRDRSECTVEVGGNETRLPISRNKLQAFLVEIGLK
ncbi:MAG TPA: LytTR family transcriptional regulator DNA-binding domain-containing protein [Geobacteraceae bacterium]|nr:LytTR family transcriptional regulator DNA-binding domain-containing protein [Geobacteraceae bacterium]